MFQKMDKERKYTFPIQLGKYTLIKLIGRGGMGEVFLAKDHVCQRTVALKKILPKHILQKTLRNRFLNEPKIAAQLPHPSIIPIYMLHEEHDTIYYTMPYIEGETLRKILIKTRHTVEQGFSNHPIGSSIQTLMMMFLYVCNAIEYTHSRGFLHRDIKPENIIIGKFNEVVILDWGVATKQGEIKKEKAEGNKEEKSCSLKGLTQPGKTVGTVEFMAPERAWGAPSSILSDIYSLGATLYFILTLHLPFNRPNSLKEWREQMKKKGVERAEDPQEMTPYREITPQLSRIAMKCLENNPNKRYKNVQEIIKDVQRYIQGNPEWILLSNFHINRESDWQFQENILLAKHMAISRYAGVMEWVMLMLSKESYSGNIQLKTKVKLKKSCLGLGFLMCIPEVTKHKGIESGYLVWIGSKSHRGCKFLRSNVEVINLYNTYLNPEQYYTLSLERKDHIFRFFIDDRLVVSYTSHIPLIGGHFGLVFRDADFSMDPIALYSGSQNVLVNCLSIPDALLMRKHHSKAIREYQRIAYCFKGRPEEWEARFRAGLALIEQGKSKKNHAQKYYSQAMEEFDKLGHTLGAPLGYLGKSLVYHQQNNLKGEVQCFQSILPTYLHHPLKHIFNEHVVFRLHESALTDRTAAYTFTFLTIRYLPNIYARETNKILIRNLVANWESIPFIEKPTNACEQNDMQFWLLQQLAFWLACPKGIYEITLDIPETNTQRFCLLENSLSMLTFFRASHYIHSILYEKYQKETAPEFFMIKNIFTVIFDPSPMENKLDLLLFTAKPTTLLPLIQQNLTTDKAKRLLPYLKKNNDYEIEYIWALLLAKEIDEAGTKLENKPSEDPKSPYYILKGCYLASIYGEDRALAHFALLTEESFPFTKTLLGHFLKKNIDLKSPWIKKAFFWEKIELYRQCALYHTCLNKPGKARKYENMIEQAFLSLYEQKQQ